MIGMVVIWLYKRIQMLETKIESMDRVVENTLSKHEKSLTEKMDKFESSSSQQKQFIQEKVDELTKTVQQHMAYLRSHSQPTPKNVDVHMMHNVPSMSGMSGIDNINMNMNMSNKPQTIDIIIPIPSPPKTKNTTTLEIIEEDDEKELLDKELEEELKELDEESYKICESPDLNDSLNKEDII